MIRRRRFLKTAIAASVAPLFRSRSVAAVERNEHILVVGAGMSGLAAARDLRGRGFRVTVLEGRDRIGGRVWSDRSLGVPLDMGASWIMGRDGNSLTAIAESEGVKLHPTSWDSVSVFGPSGAPIPDSDLEETFSEFEELSGWLEEMAESLGQDISIEDATAKLLEDEELSREDELALDWLTAAFLVLAGGAEPSEHSLRYADSGDDFGGDDVLFPGGYHQVVESVARGTEVKLGHRVTRIDHGGAKVRVETDRGAFEADRVLVTLPLGVLRAGSVRFTPELGDAKKKAIATLRMGLLDKVALRFPSAFWPSDQDFFAYASETYGEFPVFLNANRFAGAPVLMAFVAGNFGRALEHDRDEVIASKVMTVLRRISGSSIPDPVGIRVSRWAQDPFALGSYSYFPVGSSPKDYDALAAPSGDRLFFAGEATIARYYATVHGAYLSGLREADRIADL